jgi:hypothetical protein
MMHLTAQASLQANPALARQTLQITYETLTRDPSAVLGEVWRFVGLDDAASAAITATATAHLQPPPAAIPTPAEAKWLPAVAEIVAPAAAHFGYV